MASNVNNGASYCEEFRKQIVRGMEILKARGYRPVMASETEIAFTDIANPEKVDLARNALINKITTEISSENFKDIDQNIVRAWFEQNDIPYDESKHADTQKRFVDLLSREGPATIPELMMFYMQEINPKTRDILDYQYGHYEDALEVYELRIKPCEPIEWCNNFRTLKEELSKAPKSLTPELQWNYDQEVKNHTHISMHKVGEAGSSVVANNLADNQHPEHLTTYKKFIELLTKAAFDGHYFLKNPEDINQDSPIEDIHLTHCTPLKPSVIRNTGYSTEIRKQCSESHETPELTALLFCIAPMLAATGNNPIIDKADEKGEIVKARNVKKLLLPKPMHYEGGKYSEALPYLRLYMHSFIQLNGMKEAIFAGKTIKTKPEDQAVNANMISIIQETGMIDKKSFYEICTRAKKICVKLRTGEYVSSEEKNNLSSLSSMIDKKEGKVLQVLDDEATRIFDIHTDGEKAITLRGENDPRCKESWEIVNREMPVLKKYIQELAEGAQWVDRLSVYEHYQDIPLYPAYIDDVIIPRFPKNSLERMLHREGVDEMLDGVLMEGGRKSGRFINCPVFKAAFEDIEGYGGMQGAMRHICRYGRELSKGAIAYPCGQLVDEGKSRVVG